MKVLITGATGYVGMKLALQLAEGGHTVHAFCRSRERVDILVHKNITVFFGDITDKGSIDKAMATCTHVLHTAAFVSVWAKDQQTYFRINVGGTENILKLAKKNRVQRVVVTSTAGVFGPSEPGEDVNEAKQRTIPYFNEYEVSKVQVHQKVDEYVDMGVDTMVVCPTRIYGPGLIRESNSVTKMIDLYLRGKWRLLPGNGSKLGNYVFIDDVVNGHIQALTRGRSGEKYILGGENISYNDLFCLFEETSSQRVTLYRMPLFMMMAFARLQLFMAKSFGRKPLITPKWVRRYVHDWSNSSKKSQSELGYTITPLRTGVAKTVKWLNEGNHF